MLDMKLSQGLALLLAVVGFGFSAPDALAGGCSSGYSYSHHGGYHGRSVSVGYHGPNYSFGVSVGGGHHSHRSYSHRSYSYCDTPRVAYNYTYRSSYRSCEPVYYAPRHTTVTYTNVTYHQPAPQPCGYWRQVWVAPVYATHYDSHGYPYRVQVSAGYYDRVWVE